MRGGDVHVLLTGNLVLMKMAISMKKIQQYDKGKQKIYPPLALVNMVTRQAIKK
jgi:hypothetical protein